jgi:hypothetical protein
MTRRLIEAITFSIIVFVLSSCGTPSTTLPMSGSFQWVNTNALSSTTLEQDQRTCSAEAESINARLQECQTSPPQDCEKLRENTAKAMCQYSNATTKSMCSVGVLAIPKQEIVDGCIAARGWKQVWVKSGE